MKKVLKIAFMEIFSREKNLSKPPCCLEISLLNIKMGIWYLLIVNFPFVVLPSIYAYILKNILGRFVNQQQDFVLELPVQQYEYTPPIKFSAEFCKLTALALSKSWNFWRIPPFENWSHNKHHKFAWLVDGLWPDRDIAIDHWM